MTFIVQEDAEEGGYVAHAVGQAITTQADTLDELKKNVQEAVRCHFEPEAMPAVVRLRFVKEEVIAA